MLRPNLTMSGGLEVREETLTLAVTFSDVFYFLRNAIVHKTNSATTVYFCSPTLGKCVF